MPNLWHYWFGLLLLCVTSILFVFTVVASCWLGWSDFSAAVSLQVASVFLALTLAYFFFEHRSHEREERIKETIHIFTDRLRLMAVEAVVDSAETMLMDERELAELDRSKGNGRYRRARELTITREMDQRKVEVRPITYDKLSPVFDKFQRLAGYCDLIFSRIGSGLHEFGFLLRQMISVQVFIRQEASLWVDFGQKKGADAVLPSLAQSNLLMLTQVVIELVDILDRAKFRDSRRKLNRKKYPLVAFMYTNEWGEEIL